ncbi:hypothetical protein QS257_02705 [Terrilactibacillus sp. S3-3]|nr:hypothetical protein QS257_02705 [Terrilactibacillus sp. S3-3]
MGKFEAEQADFRKAQTAETEFAAEEYAAELESAANEEFAEPLDEHSAEEQERAKETGDYGGSGTKHDKGK